MAQLKEEIEQCKSKELSLLQQNVSLEDKIQDLTVVNYTSFPYLLVIFGTLEESKSRIFYHGRSFAKRK